MTPAALAAVTLSMVVNNTPMIAIFLQDIKAPCEMTQLRAAAWKKAGVPAVESQSGQWCAVGAVVDGQWVAEQWRRSPSANKSEGWLIQIPLQHQRRPGSVLGLGDHAGFGLDVQDHSIQSRLRFRQSHAPLKDHHLQTLKIINTLQPKVSLIDRSPRHQADLLMHQTQDGGMIISGAHPVTGSYSVAIHRSLGRE
jgi:hypothetical protein